MKMLEIKNTIKSSVFIILTMFDVGGLLKTLKKHCGHCESLCEDIEYNFETTMAHLQDPLKLWGDPDPKNLSEKPEWLINIHTFIHI